MKKVIFGLVLISGLQVLAEDKSDWMLRLASMTSIASPAGKIITAYAMPAWVPSTAYAKFAFYFAAGLEHPCYVAPVVGWVGVYGADPVAVSVAFSLANRCMAVEGLHETMGLSKGEAFMCVAAADQFLGKVPGLEKFAQTKWMGAVGNALEHTFGALPAGVAMMAIPLSGNFDETPSNEFSEESGIRLPAVVEAADVIQNGVLALTSFQVAKWLAPSNKMSKWVAGAGLGFTLQMLVFANQLMQQKMQS